MAKQAVMRQRKQGFKLFKVLKQKGFYICGVCRRAHKDEVSALGCLKSCVSSDLSAHSVDQLQKVKASSNLHPIQFRCKFCKRKYHSNDLADACASNCKSVFSGKHQRFTAFREGILSGDIGGGPNKGLVKSGVESKGNINKCTRCSSIYSSFSQAKACYDGHALKALTDSIAHDDKIKPSNKPVHVGEGITDEADLNFDFHDDDHYLDEQLAEAPKVHVCPVCKEEYETEEGQSQCYATHFD